MARKLIVYVAGDTRQLRREFGKATADARKFSGTIQRSLGDVARSFSLLAGGVGVAGLALSLKNATQEAAAFERTMQQIVGLSGVAQSSVNNLTKEVLQLGPSVGKGPQELAEALYFVTSSGIAAADAMDVVEVSAKAAAAGLGQTQVVADAVTSVMNAYGANAVNAAHATDVLVATVREGKGEASEFAGVIGNVVSVASQLGVSFEDVGAALAGMTRLGTSAEIAAIQLQQVFSNLLKVTPQQAKAFERVGLSAEGLRKQLESRGLVSVLKTIKTAFGDDLPTLAKAFGDIRALRGVLALVGNQADKTTAIFDRLADSSGSLQDAFSAVSDTTAQKFARLNAAVDTTRITIGAALAPAAEKAASAVADWLSETENQERVQRVVERGARVLSETIKTLYRTFRDLADVTRPVVDELGGLKNVLKLLAAAFIAVKVAKFASAITAMGESALVATGRVKALRTALLRLGAIGAITVAVEVIINRHEISSQLNEVTDEVADKLGGGRGKGLLVDLSKLDLKGLQKLRDDLKGFGGDTDLLISKIDAAIRKILELQQAASSGLTGASKVEEKRQTPGAAPRKGTAAKGVQDAADKAEQDAIDAAAAVRRANAKRKAAAKKAAAEAKKAAAEQRKAFDGLIDALQLNVDRDLSAGAFKKALADNAKLQNAIKAQIKVEGETTELSRELFEAQQERANIIKQQRTAAADALQASQFKALGLTAAGDSIVPGVANLKKQLTQLTARLGTDITPKIKAQLTRIGRVLGGEFGKVTEQTREKIKELFDTIRGTFTEETKGPLTKTSGLDTKKFLAGLGLSGDQLRELRGRLSSFNSAGIGNAPRGPVAAGAFVGGPAVLESNITVELDGQVVAKNTTRHQQKARRRNPPQRRGPNRSGI